MRVFVRIFHYYVRNVIAKSPSAACGSPAPFRTARHSALAASRALRPSGCVPRYLWRHQTPCWRLAEPSRFAEFSDGIQGFLILPALVQRVYCLHRGGGLLVGRRLAGHQAGYCKKQNEKLFHEHKDNEKFESATPCYAIFFVSLQIFQDVSK